MVKGISHIGIAVEDLDKARIFFREHLGLHSSEPEIIASGTLRASFITFNDSDITLEIMESNSPNSSVAKYLKKNGEGIHHLALKVDDIQEGLNKLRANNIKLINEQAYLNAHGDLVAFLHPKIAHGILVEFIENKK